MRYRGLLFSFIAFSYLIFHPVSSYGFDTIAKQAILLDSTTNTVLLNKEADTPMPPSSMAKLMTLYLIFDELKKNNITLDQKFMVSEKAWRTQGSKMFVGLGEQVALQDLIHGIIVQSGNDACVVMAEGLAGSEEAFAKRMTEKAQELGMKKSTFKNASGWPDPEQHVTARDLAILAQRLVNDFPDYYPLFAEKEFVYQGIKQQNRNPLLGVVEGADGLKTGHTEEGGFGLVASAVRGDRRLILVVNGLEKGKDRAQETTRLIEWGFKDFVNVTLFDAGQIIDQVAVWQGKQDTIPITSARKVVVTLPKSQENKIEAKIQYQSPMYSPIRQGDVVGELIVTLPDAEGYSVPVIAAETVHKISFLGRISWALANIF